MRARRYERLVEGKREVVEPYFREALIHKPPQYCSSADGKQSGTSYRCQLLGSRRPRVSPLSGLSATPLRVVIDLLARIAATSGQIFLYSKANQTKRDRDLPPFLAETMKQVL